MASLSLWGSLRRGHKGCSSRCVFFFVGKNLNKATKDLHYVRFSRFYWHFWANLVMHICSILHVCNIAIWSLGLILSSYATFGTKTPVFRANSGCLLSTKWQKWWIYKNISRIVKIVHSGPAYRVYICMYSIRKTTSSSYSQESIFEA